MARITGISESEDPRIIKVFQHQMERWGTALEPYQLFARRPSIFRAVLGMWGGLKESGLLDGKLTALVNRRVAALNGCVF